MTSPSPPRSTHQEILLGTPTDLRHFAHPRAPSYHGRSYLQWGSFGIERMIVAYSRAPNLGYLLSYRRIRPGTGPPVSSVPTELLNTVRAYFPLTPIVTTHTLCISSIDSMI
jgi:hypothetical protein